MHTCRMYNVGEVLIKMEEFKNEFQCRVDLPPNINIPHSPHYCPHICYVASKQNLIKISRLFIFGDHFVYPHDLYVCSSSDNVRKN